MNYQQTLDYLFAKLPMFQRIGRAAYKADLDNTIALCGLLGNPERKFRSVHVAGTNGKGSTSHMIAAILQAAGYKTGLYTSPHLRDFRERIRINGEMIPEKNVVDFVAAHKNEFEKIGLSFFEMTVGLAFDYFANEEVDIAVIEVGLGGRLDSTNVITPEVSVITNISLDHVALLGDSIEKIAAEKAGIIKKNIPVVISENDVRTRHVFIDKSANEDAPLFFADDIYQCKDAAITDLERHLFLQFNVLKNGKKYMDEVFLQLPGYYQQKNVCGVLAVIDRLKEAGFEIGEKDIRYGFSNVAESTGLMGRWQRLSAHPLVIADTGHNEAGIREVLKQIRLTPHRQLHFILGMVSDKDISKVLSMLPVGAVYYFCRAKIPRAMEAAELADQAAAFGLKGRIYSSVADALSAAKHAASDDDLVFVGGSTFTVAEVV